MSSLSSKEEPPRTSVLGSTPMLSFMTQFALCAFGFHWGRAHCMVSAQSERAAWELGLS